jgi:aminopeptidase N
MEGLTEDNMAIWNSLKRELDRAGQAAQGALDEGRLRLESHRAKQRSEAAAATLGYAVYRARIEGGELEPERYAVLAANLASAEAELARLERDINEKAQARSTPAS